MEIRPFGVIQNLRIFQISLFRTRTNYKSNTSRFKCLFAAETVEEATVFAKEIKPVPKTAFIYEVFTEQFQKHDMVWLDYICNIEQYYNYCRRYWSGEASNHQPSTGERRLPRFEILIPLPVKIGKLVQKLDLTEQPQS